MLASQPHGCGEPVNYAQWDHIIHPLVGMDGPEQIFKTRKLKAPSAFCTRSALKSSFEQFFDRR
jgi:hypothetical protein